VSLSAKSSIFYATYMVGGLLLGCPNLPAFRRTAGLRMVPGLRSPSVRSPTLPVLRRSGYSNEARRIRTVDRHGMPLLREAVL